MLKSSFVILFVICCFSSFYVNAAEDGLESRFETKLTNFISKTGETIENSRAAVALKSAQNKLTQNFQKMDQDMKKMIVKMDEFFDVYSNKVKSSTEDLRDYDFKEAGLKLKNTVSQWKRKMENRFFEEKGEAKVKDQIQAIPTMNSN